MNYRKCLDRALYDSESESDDEKMFNDKMGFMNS